MEVHKSHPHPNLRKVIGNPCNPDEHDGTPHKLSNFAHPLTLATRLFCVKCIIPIQLIKETREALLAARQHPKRGLRVRTGWHGCGVHGPRAVGRVARGERRTKTDWALDGGALRELRDGHARAGQSKHAHRGDLPRGVRADPGEGLGAAHRGLLLTEALQLAQRRGERTQRDDEAVPVRTPIWRSGTVNTLQRGGRLAW